MEEIYFILIVLIFLSEFLYLYNKAIKEINYRIIKLKKRKNINYK